MMAPSITAVLRKALRRLEAEQQRIDQQIAAIRSILGDAGDGRGRATPKLRLRPKAKRPHMSAAARRAVSQRMKTYWAKRKAAAGKGKA
jgi:Arc/MetJ-type ribon-helix-helix transcriptional regulator